MVPGPGSADANLRVQRAGDLRTLLAAFAELQQQVAALAARRSRLGWWAAGALATLVFGTPTVFVVASIVTVMAVDYLGDVGTAAAFLVVLIASVLTGVGSTIAFIWLLVRRAHVEDWELDAVKLGITEALLRTLDADLAPGSQLRLFLDLAALERGPSSVVNNARLYRQHWLRVEAKLCDGTALRVDAMTQMKEKSRRKRKYTKRRQQFIDRLQIRVASRRGGALPYDAAGRIQRRFAYASPRLVRANAQGSTAVLQLATYPHFRLRARRGWSQQGAEHRLDPAKAVGATLRAYRAVAAARVPGQ